MSYRATCFHTPKLRFRHLRSGSTAVIVALVSLTLAITLASTASADEVVCSTGAAAGQCEHPQGVAVDTSVATPTSGYVYLADSGNNRIDVFDASGSFLFGFGWHVNATAPEEKLQTCTSASGCLAGSVGSGPGQFNHPESVAVDPSTHTIYVSETRNSRIQKFDSAGVFEWMIGGDVNKTTHANICTKADLTTDTCGVGTRGGEEGQFLTEVIANLPIAIAIGPGNVLYVADAKPIGEGEGDGFNVRIQRFTPSGTIAAPQCVATNFSGRMVGLVVNSLGDAYTTTENVPKAGIDTTGGLNKYDSSCSSYGGPFPIASSNFRGLALDPSGNVFVAEQNTIREFTSGGIELRNIFPNSLKDYLREIAYYSSASGDLFATEANGLLRVVFPPPGPVLVPGSVSASSIGGVRATLKVTVNPQGKPSTARFQYVDMESFESEGGFASPNTQTTLDSEPTPGGFENRTAAATNLCAVPTEPSCLDPETTYYFRAIAQNSDGEVISDKAQFTTRPPHEIDAIWSSDVGTDSARLHAEVNPLGIEANGYFQYIAEGPDYQANGFANALAAPDAGHPFDLGSGEAPVTRVAQPQGLDPGTIYHYRFVAKDPYFPAVISNEQTFTTFKLPAAEECAANQPFRTGPSAALPNCRAYEMVSPLDKDNGDVLTRINITGFPTRLNQSAVDGSGFAYTSYRAFGGPEAAPYTNQYLAVRKERGEAEEGWSTKAIAPPRGRQFRFELENVYQAFSAELERGWLLQEGEPTLDPCAPAGISGLYRRDNSDGSYAALTCASPRLSAPPTEYMPELQGFSADGSKALIRINNKLTSEAFNAPIYQLYESTGGAALRLVSTLPNGQPSGMNSSAGTATLDEIANHNRFNNVLSAMSEDGTRVFWTAGTASTIGANGTRQIYLRLNSDQGQSAIVGGECSQPVKACTIPVSGTVSTAPAYFQAANPEGTEALFSITEGPLAGNLYRFDAEAEPPASELIAEGVIESILGASRDLSRVYFVSSVASAPAQAEGALPGQPNVYLAEGASTRFVGTLSGPGPQYQYPDTSNVYGTPMGRQPIFRTARVSPDGRSVVFMSNSRALADETADYDNEDLDNGQPNLEVYMYDAEGDNDNGALRCISCNPSGARPRGREVEQGTDGNEGPSAAAVIPRFENQLYQPRYLSDDGNRVYFNSFESLVLRDTNGVQDVYQWEAVGSSGCTAQSSSYVPSSEGCLNLISSGKSPEDSEFLDASPSGSDVFIATGESLLVQDYGLIDVYDARVDGGFPSPPEPPPGCEGEACQPPPAAPDDPSPASAVFQGAGNVKEPAPRCKKGKVRRKGRCVKKQHKTKKHPTSSHKHRRAAR